jgi:predicted dehydrogenase
MNTSLNRRDFVKLSSAGIASAFVLGGVQAQTPKGANNKLVAALVGCGGRGTSDAGRFKDSPNVELAYVCDVDKNRLAKAAEKFGLPANKAVSDMRRVLDDKSVDIVIVTTPDHWHAIGSILACEAGKHVYVEKPISHNIREGRLLVEASARNKTLVQHGTQSRSTSTLIEGVKKLREGIIGDVLVARCWNIKRRGALKPGEDTAPPPELDYENWVGPATMIPYRTNRVHNRWTMWYHFGVGESGNDGVHDIDYARWGLGVETHPTKISAYGGKYLNDEAEFPDTQQATFEYPGDGKPGSHKVLIYEQRLWSRNVPNEVDSGAEFYGSKGQMFLSRRGKLTVLDENNKPVALNTKLEGQNDVAHVQNLCDCIRNGGEPTANALTGHLSTSLAHLANIATRVGRALTFDPAKEQFIGDEEANKLVAREYRDHWGKPRGA